MGQDYAAPGNQNAELTSADSSSRNRVRTARAALAVGRGSTARAISEALLDTSECIRVHLSFGPSGGLSRPAVEDGLHALHHFGGGIGIDPSGCLGPDIYSEEDGGSASGVSGKNASRLFGSIE